MQSEHRAELHQKRPEAAGPVGADIENGGIFRDAAALAVGEVEADRITVGGCIAERFVLQAQVDGGFAHPIVRHTQKTDAAWTFAGVPSRTARSACGRMPGQVVLAGAYRDSVIRARLPLGTPGELPSSRRALTIA